MARRLPGLAVVSVVVGFVSGMAVLIAPPAQAMHPAESGLAQALKTADEDYTRAMNIGYAATEAEDYQTALINFRRALKARPGDAYAIAAIRNVESYIARIRAEEARKKEIANLQALLALATSQKDWACAAATVDRLVTLMTPDSLDQATLVAYRGQLTGLMDDRANLENWSTVCPG